MSTPTSSGRSPASEAIAALLAEARADPPNPGNAEERLPDEGNAARFVRFFAREQPTVVYFGKLIENKGVQVLLEAIAGFDARAVVVGFGDYRDELRGAGSGRTLFTGPLEHRHLRHLLPLCDVAVVPSIFPEAFGMVAAEAAAAGVLPVVSAHSGLAEVAAGIGAEVGPEAAALLSFPAGSAAALRERLAAILALPAEERRELGLAARAERSSSAGPGRWSRPACSRSSRAMVAHPYRSRLWLTESAASPSLGPSAWVMPRCRDTGRVSTRLAGGSLPEGLQLRK